MLTQRDDKRFGAREKMNLYVIEDHPVMRQAVVMLLRRLFPIATVVELDKFSDFASATVKNGDPQLVILDLLLPRVKDTNAISEIKAMFPDVLLVVLSSLPAGEVQERCISAGADLYIEKSTSANEISQALLKLFAHDSEGESQKPLGEIKLSKRQKQLIVLLERGLSNREIATELEISEHTVKVHLWRLFKRLGVNSRTQTLYYARQTGLL